MESAVRPTRDGFVCLASNLCEARYCAIPAALYSNEADVAFGVLALLRRCVSVVCSAASRVNVYGIRRVTSM